MVSLFTTPYDVANRALQKLGGRRITAFTDTSKNAAEAAFLYDKLRVAELRRNVWRFGTRKTPLRPVTFTSGVPTTGIITPLTWLVGTTYAAGAIVADPTITGFYWRSQAGTNLAHTPNTDTGAWWVAYFGGTTTSVWSASVTYVRGDIVNKSSTVAYVSLQNSNLNHDPASGSPYWLSLGALTNGTLNILDPVDLAGDGTATARSIYVLPTGFLRLAMQDPKAASTPNLNTSGGIQYNDWEYNGNFFTSAATTGLQIFRFVADITDVPSMDSLFCEGLAARLAYELCETLTQSPEKKKAVAAEYAQFIGDARLINAIEIGTTEPTEEEYLGARTIEESGPGHQPQGR